MGKTAILVDGGFYRKRANSLFGHKTPEERASELISYCNKHIDYATKDSPNELYRIFYYDCRPLEKTVFNPITQKSVNLKKSELYSC